MSERMSLIGGRLSSSRRGWSSTSREPVFSGATSQTAAPSAR